MTPAELEAIRERAEAWTPNPYRQDAARMNADARKDRRILLAEVERLTGERDAANSVLARYIVDRTAFSDALAVGAVPSIVDAIMHELTADSDRRAKIAQARLDKVRALHETVVIYPMAGDVVNVDAEPLAIICRECSDDSILEDVDDGNWSEDVYGGMDYPCPTIQCLDGSDQ